MSFKLPQVGGGPSSNTSKSGSNVEVSDGLRIDPLVRMTVILARGEANKWKKRIETQAYVEPENSEANGQLQISRIL
jgi:hypothetical protein